jgi:hypothetical protein
MNVPKIGFIVGVILLCVGIVIATVAPATTTWKPESRTLADEETLTVSAGWTSKSDELIEKVLTVSTFSTYDYWFGYKPLIFEEAKDFVITGSATEQSSPQRWFNFYIFDSINFDLWKAGSTYTAYYETKGKTSVSFTFSIASEEDVPNTFYFVAEEYTIAVKPTVLVNATISWAEKTSRSDCSEYYMSSLQITFEQTKGFKLRGNATEVNGNKFNFYIMDSSNYWNWVTDKPYTTIFEQKNVASVSFDKSLTSEQASSVLYFVVENPLKDVNESVSVSADLEWQEKATIATTIGGWILGGAIAIIGIIVILISGVSVLVFKRKPKTQ